MPRGKSKTATSNGANLGYEAQLWQMADALRGSMDAAEYEHMLPDPIVPPRAFPQAFEEHYRRLWSVDSPWSVITELLRRCVAMRSVETLMHEHRVIEHGLAVLEAMADRLERGEPVPTDKATALLDFFRVFADECHHAKEEGALFPELEARGVPREGGPIGVMSHEHEEGRTLQQRMRQALGDFSDAAKRRPFVDAARAYVSLLRQHIWKEDNVLFQMAQRVLTNADDAELVERFDRHDRERLGEGGHEHYHRLVHELEAEFLEPISGAHAEVDGSGKVLDVCNILPCERHPLIFQTFGALKSGESFVLANDHDRKPRYYEFHYEHQGQFT